MRVKELEIGQLYMSKDWTSFRVESHKATRKSIVPIVKIWACLLPSLQENKDNLYLYVGTRTDEWSFNGIFKHHYFLMDGREMVIDSKSIRHLETVSGTV